MTKTKPMTDEWKISEDELNNWERHIDGTIGYGITREVEVEEVINTVKAVLEKATAKAREEERKRIQKEFIDNSPAFVPPDSLKGFGLASMILSRVLKENET